MATCHGGRASLKMCVKVSGTCKKRIVERAKAGEVLKKRAKSIASCAFLPREFATRLNRSFPTPSRSSRTLLWLPLNSHTFAFLLAFC